MSLTLTDTVRTCREAPFHPCRPPSLTFRQLLGSVFRGPLALFWQRCAATAKNCVFERVSPAEGRIFHSQPYPGGRVFTPVHWFCARRVQR